MGRAGPVVRVRSVGRKNRRERERCRNKRRGSREKTSNTPPLFCVCFHQF